MTTVTANVLFTAGAIDEGALFDNLFSPAALEETYLNKFAKNPAKGTDRLSGIQFSARSSGELANASSKCKAGQYRFAPYLENLKTKGRHSYPRLIGIPIVRDRVVLSQLNQFLAAIFPDCVPKNVASAYVRAISADLTTKDPTETWVCGVDIKSFYNSIRQDRLIKILRMKITTVPALKLIERALLTPTVPKFARRRSHRSFRSTRGVPQGLAISNILAAIYMKEVDAGMQAFGITYYRYVDDILMYGDKDTVMKAHRSLRVRLARRGLAMHPLGAGKSHAGSLSESFGYLGYIFDWPIITVRESTIEYFLQSIAASFSDHAQNKDRKLARRKYLTEARLSEIFLLELNERITGAISEKRRYGWIAYFNQITDLSLLHRLDDAIAAMFRRLPDFENKAPPTLKRLARAYFEMKYNPTGGYVRNYDVIKSTPEKLQVLVERGRVGPGEFLTDEQIEDRFETYRKRVLSEMHADEGVLYG